MTGEIIDIFVGDNYINNTTQIFMYHNYIGSLYSVSRLFSYTQIKKFK